MKKLIAVMMVVALVLPCGAFAVQKNKTLPLSPLYPLHAENSETSFNAISRWQSSTNTVYVPVKRYQRVGDGWSEPQTYYPAVGRVEYKYWYELDEKSNTWQGGCAINNTYPRPYAISGGQADLLEPVFAKVSNPSGTFHTSSTGFTISVVGGSFSVTYNSSLYYDTDGSLHHVERTTMMRSHNWSFTGP